MASYTMMLQEYIEQATQDTENLSTRDRIEAGRSKLFDFDYPIFDLNYKKTFETHFIRNFYMREIGFETEGLFKFKLENWLSINMPYYNKLFESELIEYDPLKNTVMDETDNRTKTRTQTDDKTSDVTSNITGTGDTTVDSTSHLTGTQGNDTTETVTDDKFNRNLESDSPDNRLNITTNDGQGVIEYASKITEDNENNSRSVTKNDDVTLDNLTTDHGTNTTNTTQDTTGNQTDHFSSNINDTDDYVKHIVGKAGTQSYPKMVQEFRESFIRIEKRIFDEMQELFMIVY